MEINTINLVGRAGREPDVRYFESGSIVANFTIAVNRRSRDEEPDWFNLEIWGKQAQIAADYVKNCLLYTSPSPRDLAVSRMPSSA